jgi:hypothetical protein
MSYHSPLDDAQYDRAIRSHALMRANLRELRRAHAPRSSEETVLLEAYRNAIQEFGRELLRSRGTIRPVRLNELNDAATSAYVVYLASRVTQTR